MINPSGWFYYTPYHGYYNQMAPGHHQAAAAAQHATGHPIYVAPHMPMYGHHMMGGYPQGMFMYPTAAAPHQGVVQTGPSGIISPEYQGGFADAGKGNFVQTTVPVVATGEDGQPQYEVIQPPQQQQHVPGQPQQAGGEPNVIWTQGTVTGPVEYQEMVVVDPQQQQMQPPGGETMEEYSNAVVVDQGYMDQQQQTPTHVHHTLNPNVANFMPLKQQQEMSEQEESPAEVLYNENGEQLIQQQVQLMPPGQEMMVQQSGYEHVQQQTLAYDMSGQPIMVNEQGEVAYLGNVVVPEEFNQQQQVPLSFVTEPQAGGMEQQQQQPPNNIVYTNMSNINSPKVPVVATTSTTTATPIEQNNNAAAAATSAPPTIHLTSNVIHPVASNVHNPVTVAVQQEQGEEQQQQVVEVSEDIGELGVVKGGL